MLLNSILIFGITGLLIGVMLALVEKLFAVKEDPKLEEVLAVLPGVNCGACGYPGCSGYASSVAEGKAQPNRCTVGGSDVAKKIAKIMDVEAKEVEKCVARLFCRGGMSMSAEKFDYRGITSCVALNITDGGNKACSYGCLGMGDCVNSCPFGALYLSEDKLPVVIEEKCRACGKCVQACPRGLFELVPVTKKVIIACKSHDTGPDTRKACKVGCIACRICEKKCPSAAIRVESDLAVIDYSKCNNKKVCVDVCPQKVILDVSMPNEES